MRNANRLIVCLIVAVIAGAAPDALAQFPGGGGRARGGLPRGDMQRGERPAAVENISELIEFRLESFQEDLKLTPNQQKLWDPYADKVKALAADIMRERARARTAQQMTAPQQIDHALDVARNRVTALEDVAASAKTLYDGLTREQKLLADSRFATIVPLIAGSAPASGAPDQTGRPAPDRGLRDRDAGAPR